MNNEEKHERTTQAQNDNLDEQIYRAMVERGWVFPQTIEEVEIIEEQIECETAPSRTGLPTAEAILKKMAGEWSGKDFMEAARLEIAKDIKRLFPDQFTDAELGL